MRRLTVVEIEELDGEPVAVMSADELRHISRKLTTYADIYTGDKEARRMADRCLEVAALLDVRK
jgi:hypothetical protein